MAPHPEQIVVMHAGLRPPDHPALRKSSNGELDEERKQELILEKRLRACRVSIIPKGANYYEPAPLPKKPPPPPISVEAVKKATNPIALRYWNQCSNRNYREETPVKVVHTTSLPVEEKPPWVTSDLQTSRAEEKPRLPAKKMSVPNIMGRMGRAGSVGVATVSGPRQRVQSLDRGPIQPSAPPVHHDDPSPMGSPNVVQVLSSAGSGSQRENERKEAVGNINRMFSMVKIRKEDPVQIANPRSPDREQEPGSSFEESRVYQKLKEEEILKSKQRACFLGGSEQIRIPKSPKPFRESSPQVAPQERQCSCREKFATREVPFNTVTDLIPKLNQQQATHIGLSLFKRMTEDTVRQVLAHQLNGMTDTEMSAVFAGLSNKALNTVVPLLCGKTSTEVRTSISADLLSSLPTAQKMNVLFESEEEEEIPIIVEGLLERLGYSERRKLVKTLFDHDPEGLKEMSTSSFSSFEKVNELGEGEFGRRCRPQLDSGGEQWFKSSEEEEDGFY